MITLNEAKEKRQQAKEQAYNKAYNWCKNNSEVINRYIIQAIDNNQYKARIYCASNSISLSYQLEVKRAIQDFFMQHGFQKVFDLTPNGINNLDSFCVGLEDLE